MYKAPKKECQKCKSIKYLFEFKQKGTWVSPTCKECLKIAKKPSELDKLTKAVPAPYSFWKKPKWKSNNFYHST